MADEALHKLRAAFTGAAGDTITMNAAFWQATGLTAPADFDALLVAAFQASAGLAIGFDHTTVGEVADGRFAIPTVTFAFFGAEAATLQASLSAQSDGDSTPILFIDFAPAGWKLTDPFPFLAGTIYDLVDLATPSFCFASAAATHRLDAIGEDIAVAAGMTYYGMLGLPTNALPLLDVVAGLAGLPTSLPMYGGIDFTGADDDADLLPAMSLQAPLTSDATLTLFLLEVSRPRLEFVITNETAAPDDGADDEDEDFDGPFDETASLPAPAEIVQFENVFLALDLSIKSAGAVVGLTMEATVRPGKKAPSSFQFRIIPRDDAPLTPQAAIALLAGNSFFTNVPTPLQSCLAGVRLQGATISGWLAKPTRLVDIGIRLGSTGQPIRFFSDPTTGAPFTIESFALQFVVSNPADAPSRTTSATFEASFTLFPDVFRKKTGEPGGLFEITIDDQLDFEGGFSGKASFDDVLRKITGGVIGLPDGVSIDFSDIYLVVQSSTRTYGLEFMVDAAVEVPFVSNGGQPLIQLVGMTFKLGASTPKADAGKTARTVYTGRITGQVMIGSLAASVDVAYDGAAAIPVWRLSAALTQPLRLSELVDQFFSSYQLPPLLPGDLQVVAFSLDAVIPGKASQPKAERALSLRAARHVTDGPHHGGWRSPARPLRLVAQAEAPNKSYAVSGTLTWDVPIGSISIKTKAVIGIAYDGAKPDGQRFSGSVIGTIDIDAIGEVEVGYRFGPASADVAHGAPAAAALATATGSSTTLWLVWKGFRAAYDSTAGTVTFTLTGWSVGSLVTALVAMLGKNPYFTLPSPWDVLDAISLDGLTLVFHLKNKVGEPRVSASYKLASPLDLGIVSFEGFSFAHVAGKIRFGLLEASSPVPAIKDSSLLKPEGQDVEDMPKVPGRGNAYFDLRLLALGQRVKIHGASAFGSTKDVIDALAAVPPSDGTALPFDPSQRVKGQPFYDPSSNWLAAMNLGLLRIGDTKQYAIELMIVFNDPDLYGLRLALSGDRVKVLAGLVVDVLYKKITDDVGCYQIEFALPSALRNLDFGAFGVTLPVIGLQIYTNGDFLIDFGFPYNLDFSRSFTAQAIIMGVPVLGSAGFYFGKLSNATAKGLPVTTRGTFHPVIVFGFGAQLGVGKTIDKGILKAGFSITIFGIIEGTIAAWHPYAIGNSGPASQVQGDFYFKLSGSFGIIGKLYGTVDFAIIKADVSLTVQIVASIAYVSFRAIPLSLSASVSIHVSVSIDCGFFSISIGFSFETRLQVELTIGHDSSAPWDGAGTLFIARHLHSLGLRGPIARFDIERAHRLRAQTFAAAPSKEVLRLTAVPQFTVHGPVGGAVEGAFVLLFAMDAPQAGQTGDGAATSFGSLCAALLPWVLAGTHAHPATRQGLADGSVSRVQLEAILVALSDTAMPPFDADAFVAFLADHFTIVITAGDTTLAAPRRAELDAGTTIFPALPALSLTIPDPAHATGSVTIDLSGYATATPDYETAIRKHFAAIAAAVAQEDGGNRAAALVAPRSASPQPLAACVLVDYALLVARQLVQSAIDAFDDFAFPLQATTSLGDILAWVDAAMPGQVSLATIASANLHYPLAAKQTLAIGDAGDPLTYTVQAADTADAIAARYGIGAAKLLAANAELRTLVVAGVTFTLAAASTIAIAGDSFTIVADRLGGVGVDKLVQDATVRVRSGAPATSIAAAVGLLAPGVTLVVPGVTVTTIETDTLQALMDRFSVSLGPLLVASNQTLRGLFKIDPALRFAIPALAVLPEAELWPAILRAGTLGHLAGMAARYMMHGMRLPVLDGLHLPPGFLYGAARWPAQTAYGLYQLTGQQFPLAETNPGGAITLSRPAAAYDWLQVGGGATLTAALASIDPKVLGPKELLGKVLGVVRTKGFAPSVTGLAVEPQVDVVPKRYATGAHTRWASTDMAGLVAAAMPSAARVADAPQPKPMLWSLSSALMRAAETRQAALSEFLPGTDEPSRYMPRLGVEVGTRDPATGETHFETIADYALATRIDFKIKHLAQTVDLAPQTPLANDIVPPGPGNSGSWAKALAPCAYEIVGPSAADAVLLERLLTAMAVRGQGILSGLFLAYADATNGGVGLVSRAPAEFLSFIVQSNLSTETNPPSAPLRLAALAAPAPRGIANSPAEFIKLLWELSTVNSGGTYLFFQLVADGSGLPAALFDASGLATLTLIVTHAHEAAGARLSNATNALLTIPAIDPDRAIVDLVGVPAPVPSLAVAADATPRALAAAYGIEPGDLARANPGAALGAGRRMPVSGLYRQLEAADMASGDPLAVLAAYYSIGAVTPLKRADIAAFNPGVSIAAGALFRIPPFIYQVVAAGPGTTLASIAAYYAADPTALVVAAGDVAGLFAGPTLTIEPRAVDAQIRLGLGNAGLTLHRERGDKPQPLAPTAQPAEVEAYARASMLQLYQLAAVRLVENAFFHGSVDSASFGPKEPGENGGAPAQIRQLAAPMRAVAPGAPFFYEQALGYRGAAKIEAARAGAGLPAPDTDPYRGIGTILQAGLAWQDLFGNRVPGAFAAGSSGVLPTPLLYSDRLVPIDQWPSTLRTHRYDGKAGAPILHVELAFDPTPYNPSADPRNARLDAVRPMDDLPVWQRGAIDDLAAFTRIYFQLVQDYTGLGLPGVTGPAVSIALRQSLLDAPVRPLADGERVVLMGFVEAAIGYLAARAQAQPAAAPAQIDLLVPVDIGALVGTSDIVEIVVALEFERQAALVAPALRGMENGTRVACTIPAHGGKASAADAGPVGFQAYAEAFEAAFATADWTMRAGAGAADPAAPANARATTLWAVRMARPGNPAAKGLSYAIGGEPIYYAPLPVASSLQTFTTRIRPYVSGAPDRSKGGGVQTTFASADPNAWLAECLTALDDVLSATYATPCFVLDRLLGLTDVAVKGADPSTRGYLARLLQHKATLARAIASTVRPVLAQAETMQATARDKLEQALMRRLDAVNTLACVAVFPVTKATAMVSPGKASPRLFGQPIGTLRGREGTDSDGADRNANFAFSTAKVELGRTTGDGNSALAFLVTSRAAEQQAYVALDLSYAVTNVEHDMHGISGIDRYEQSRWISFLTPMPATTIVPTKGAHFAIPVALRALPTPATVETQTGTSASDGGTAADLKAWTYGFSYLLNQAAQDSVVATVEFNLPPAGLRAFAGAPDQALYEALAQFSAIHAAVARDLESFLRPIDGRSAAGSPDVGAAENAVAAFEAIVGQVATAYEAWASRLGSMALAAAPPPAIVYEFELTLEPDADGTSAVAHVRPQSFKRDGLAATYALPLARIEIDDVNYAPELVASVPATGEVCWRYRRRTPDGGLLPYETARLDRRRRIVFTPLDVVALQNAWSAVQVVRNRHLGPPDSSVVTNPAFEFKSAASRFADPMVPLLRRPSFALDGAGAPPQPVQAWLSGFFDALLPNAAEAAAVSIALEAGYRYALVPATEVPPTRLAVGMVPPTRSSVTAEPQLVQAAAAAAQRFFDEQAPRTDPRAGFDFALTLFLRERPQRHAAAPGRRPHLVRREHPPRQLILVAATGDVSCLHLGHAHGLRSDAKISTKVAHQALPA